MRIPSERPAVPWLIIVILALFPSCAPMKLNPLPEPPPTAKLRVYVEAFTRGPVGRHWAAPHAVFAKNRITQTGRFLEKTGIYEVVSDADVRSVVGDQVLSYEGMMNFGQARAREIGRALHADYVFIVTRDKSNVGTGEWAFLFTTELVNVETGKIFQSRFTVENIIGSDLEHAKQMIRETYRDLFKQAKHDMMAVAMRKGRLYGPQLPSGGRAPEVPPAERERPAAPAPPPPHPAQPAPEKEAPSIATAVPSPNLPGTGLIETPKKDAGGKKLVVYDLESTDQYRTVALILAEALREEVFKLKQFTLVNREDLQKVLDEIVLQQTGLIDEKQAVATGRGLAANQVVTGKLGLLGRTFVMQAKRVDVETFATLGVSSAKFTEGQEEEVLNKLPEFARALAGLK